MRLRIFLRFPTLAVLPEYQGKGIGSKFVQEGLSSIQECGAKGCMLVGDPAYYERFGFSTNPGLILSEVPAENFLVLSFDSVIPEGEVTFHPAFLI
jgi:putative acetyltransferase